MPVPGHACARTLRVPDRRVPPHARAQTCACPDMRVPRHARAPTCARRLDTSGRLIHRDYTVTESTDLLTLDEVAERLGVPPKRVQQMLRDHVLAAVSGEGGAKRVPADFLIPAEGGRC